MPQLVVVKTAKATEKLRRLKEKDVPFMVARSLTELAGLAKEEIGNEAERIFNLHTQFIPRQVRVKPALKTKFKQTGFTSSKVFSSKKIDGWMTKHVKGGIKKPFKSGSKDKGKGLAIKGKNLNRKTKTSTGRTRKNWKPKELLKFYRSSKGKRKANYNIGGRSPKKKAFIIRDTGTGLALIVKRTSKRTTPLQIVYVLVPKAKIRPSWDWSSVTKNTVNKMKKPVFERNFKRIIKAG